MENLILSGGCNFSFEKKILCGPGEGPDKSISHYSNLAELQKKFNDYKKENKMAPSAVMNDTKNTTVITVTGTNKKY